MIKAYELLESTSWKVEKVTASNDIICTSVQPIGKVYKLRAKVNFSAKKLLYELFYNIENVPVWNPTLMESRIIKKIDSNTDIAYSISTAGGGGLVASRDFVNLRCWKLVNNSRVIENYDINSSFSALQVDIENSYDRKKVADRVVNKNVLTKSVSDVGTIGLQREGNISEVEHQLSKSLGMIEDDEPFADAQVEAQSDLEESKNVFVSAAISIDYAKFPPTSKYIRGNNRVSCWAMRPIQGEENSCIFEWVLCIDLKGSLPKYILNTVG